MDTEVYFDANAFGLTDDVSRLDAALAYAMDAGRDGWLRDKTVGDNYIRDTFNFTREGFVMHIMARVDPGPKYKYQASVYIWGPDRLVVKPPDIYNWEEIKAGLRVCNICDARDVDTERYSFAGRCCSGCIDKARAQYEKPGWTR